MSSAQVLGHFHELTFSFSYFYFSNVGQCGGRTVLNSTIIDDFVNSDGEQVDADPQYASRSTYSAPAYTSSSSSRNNNGGGYYPQTTMPAGPGNGNGSGGYGPAGPAAASATSSSSRGYGYPPASSSSSYYK